MKHQRLNKDTQGNDYIRQYATDCTNLKQSLIVFCKKSVQIICDNLWQKNKFINKSISNTYKIINT